MDRREFQTNLQEPLSLKYRKLRNSDFYEAYDDLLNIFEICTEYSKAISSPGNSFFDLIDSGKQDQAAQAMQMGHRTVTLLKSMYFFSSIFLDLLFRYLSGDDKISILRLIKDGQPGSKLLNLSSEILQPIYCLAVFRNKIITHHEFSRNSHATLGVNLTYTCVPESQDMNQAGQSMLEELAKKYYSDESGNLKLQNRWDQLFALFYRIPFGKVGEVNPERDIIDKITERSGGRSMEPDHIIKAVDNLCMELVSVM